MSAALPGLLPSLTTRSAEDPSIALLDAWAVVGDVLTFYQERIANEGYIRTSTELRSVLELARSIGYELRPGVAAGAYLAFTVETAAGAPESATVKLGTKVKSVPGQDERPQTFETTAEITARGEWNAMRPRRTKVQVLDRGTRQVRLEGLNTGLQQGDGILIVGDERIDFGGSERWDFRIVSEVRMVPGQDATDPGQTHVSWELGLGEDRNPGVMPSQAKPRVFALRRRASLFGYNAPDWRTMPDDVKAAFDPAWDRRNPDGRKTQWPDFQLPTGGAPEVDLDSYYPRVLPGSWMVFDGPRYSELYRVVKAEPSSRTDYAVSAKTTRVTMDASEHLSWFELRSTVVHAESDELPMAEAPITDAVAGRAVSIVPAVAAPAPGQLLVFSGRPSGSDVGDDRLTEVAAVASCTVSGQELTIQLAAALRNAYDAADLVICANVAPATHGETVEAEVLGSGDGTASFQRYMLTKPPLTYVPATTPSGVASTLTVRVNGVAWSEAPSLYGLGPGDQRYTLRRDEAQRTTVTFGDGKSGSRLPSGAENVVATYRSGLGPEGNVDVDALTLLQTRPLGIRSVTNPLPADGGAAPESLSEARVNGPLTVLTLDRAVSLQDYEDFARSFAGISKAKVVALWTGARHVIHVTVAGPDGAQLSADSFTLLNLRRAIDRQRDPGVHLVLAPHRAKSFLVHAAVLADDRFDRSAVLGDVRAGLAAAFSVERRSFAQPVTAAEVTTVIHAVRGVVATNIVALHAFDPANPPQPDFDAPRADVLVAAEATFGPSGYLAAELLAIDPERIAIEVMAP